jgi:hypothetical protein
MNWQPILVQILYAILPLLIPLAVAWVAQEARKYYHAKLTKEQQATIENYVRQAVQFAEQSGLAGQAKLVGAQNKELALNWLQGVLLSKGIAFDVRWLDGAIEAAVYEQFHASPQSEALHTLAVNTAQAPITRDLGAVASSSHDEDASGRCGDCPARHCGDCPIQQ